MAEQKWFEGLRRQIKHRCGAGWGIDERHVHSLSWDNDRVHDELITWQIAKDNGNKPIRKGGAKGFSKAIAALEQQGLGECLQVGTVMAFKATKPFP